MAGIKYEVNFIFW